MDDEMKKDPELFDQATGREIAASGYPAPTPEEAVHELNIMANLLKNHGCATTRDLINAASIAVNIAHKDAHSGAAEGVQEKLVAFSQAAFTPLQAAINDEVGKFETLEDKAKFYARMTSILLQIARITGAASFRFIKEAQETVAGHAEFEGEYHGTTEDTLPGELGVDSSPIPGAEVSVKKLLDTPVKTKYKM